MVSLVTSQSEILAKNVVLTQRLDLEDKDDESDLSYLKAVVLVRPLAANVEALLRHLRHPRFREIHIGTCASRGCPTVHSCLCF